MADSFISTLITELTAKTTAADTDLVPIADSNGNFFKMTWQKLKQLLLGTKDISSVGDGTVTGAISELNTNFAVVNEEISITPATAKQITWKNITLPKGTYIITLFLQLKSDSPARNYLAMYANNADFSGTLPLADIYNGTTNFSNTSVNIIRVSKSCTINCAYLTPVSCAVAYHIYKVK